ncbi:hypothetical protein W911_16740 [Hyphomicrobium nitrativorans NL23]|uniref:Uncharacterized protein n=1 Tax=Hyphomicrobium nitrativorans NL23 TaxID=1029756 RepID=V5SHU4_9HYPH|nr:hypothetical protein W911_16740 [Hyphomicrobium nitrativorans NL23]
MIMPTIQAMLGGMWPPLHMRIRITPTAIVAPRLLA